MDLKRLAVVLSVVVVAACGGDPYGTDGGGGGGTGAGGRSTTITVSSNFFSPTPDTVAAGTVTFSWSAGPHNVTWDSGPSTPANSGDKSSGTHPVTVQTGTYAYHCSLHGTPSSGMRGRIVVE